MFLLWRGTKFALLTLERLPARPERPSERLPDLPVHMALRRSPDLTVAVGRYLDPPVALGEVLGPDRHPG